MRDAKRDPASQGRPDTSAKKRRTCCCTSAAGYGVPARGFTGVVGRKCAGKIRSGEQTDRPKHTGLKPISTLRVCNQLHQPAESSQAVSAITQAHRMIRRPVGSPEHTVLLA